LSVSRAREGRLFVAIADGPTRGSAAPRSFTRGGRALASGRRREAERDIRLVSEEDASKASPRAKDLPKEGNADTAIAAAEVVLEADYDTPTQHHNPIELFTTTAVWRDGENDVHLLRRKAELIP
jgi:hypothetical protein